MLAPQRQDLLAEAGTVDLIEAVLGRRPTASRIVSRPSTTRRKSMSGWTSA